MNSFRIRRQHAFNVTFSRPFLKQRNCRIQLAARLDDRVSEQC